MIEEKTELEERKQKGQNEASENFAKKESEKVKMKKSFKISISAFRNTIFIICLVIISAWGGHYVGKNNLGFWNKVNYDNNNFLQKINKTQPDDKKEVDMSLFWMIWDQLEQDFLFDENIDYQKMVYGAISGMTKALGDPYTAYYPPKKNQTSKENLNGSFFGVGIQLGYKMGDQLAVIAPLSGMPAEKAGVKAGDYILKIEDETKGISEDTYGMGVMDAVELIRGEEGTKVKLILLHDSENEPYEVEIVREEIIVPSVEVKFGKVSQEGIYSEEATASGEMVALLKLSRFGDLSSQQWDESVDEIIERKNEVKGIVLDLRNNPGGLMQEAVNLAAEFLPKGEVVVKQESKQNPTVVFKTERQGRLLDIPLVVLINKGSASASEIMAGALSEYGRAQLVGETSFGKGTIQSAGDFSDGSGLHMTIAKWVTPEENWVHDKGIEPDVIVELDKDRPELDTQVNKAAELVVRDN